MSATILYYYLKYIIMYIVGLINKQNVLKTYHYSDKETAIKELKDYKKDFQDNNMVDERTTIVKRNSIDEIVSIKEIMRVKGEDYIMFLSKVIDG